MTEADYLVVGAGAMGMAFVDTIVSETDASVVMVDRAPRPGGHWTLAYPFVRLHQPSAYYGVNSRPLGGGAVDDAGWNEGLHELATGDEVCAYFDAVMREQFVASGRVAYFPSGEYLGGTRFRDSDGVEHDVHVRRRVVDATHHATVVPAMRPPPYDVVPGIDCVPPNDLPGCTGLRDRYVVIGAGKTGVDACLWLLANNVPADRLTWVMPRDAWLLDRASIQPGAGFSEAFAARLQAINAATSVDDLFGRLEAAGDLLRLDPAVRPSMYRCATVSPAELDQLRRIADVVRMGHVTRIEPSRVVLTGGTLSADPNTMYVDCTADGLARRPGVPVFGDGRITLQSVRGCQQVFSAALIGHVEAAYDDDDVRNDLCVPVPHPDSARDWLSMHVADHRNQLRWSQDIELMTWLGAARLNVLAELFAPILARPRITARLMGMMAKQLTAADERLVALLDE